MTYRPTPYSISLATLISLHCEENSTFYSNQNGIDQDFSRVDSFIQILMLDTTDDSRKKSSWTRLTAPRITSLLNRFALIGVRREILNSYDEWLRVAALSVDSLTDLMATLQRSVTEGTIDAMSSNGIFVRGVCLGFDELSFESTVQIWIAFSRELAESGEKYQSIFPEWTLSPSQMERGLRKQCIVNATRHVQVSAHAIHPQIQKILEYNPELPSSHFMRFVLCLEAGERVGAIDALHQYVDYVLINIEQQQALEALTEDNLPRKNEEILQFAAIIKTALHRSFGDRALAVAATEEAVRVAQQSQDTACVAFALGWLALYAKDFHGASQLIQRCIHRATEGNLRSLAAGANLTLASCQPLLQHQLSSHAASSVADDRPLNAVQAWNRWSDASSTDPTSSTDAEASRWDQPVYMTHMGSGDQALDILGRQRLVAAGIWDNSGLVAQSGLSSFLALHNHGNKLPSQDINVAIQNIGRRVIVGSISLVSCESDENRQILHNHLDSLGRKHSRRMNIAENDCIYGKAIRLIIGLQKVYNFPTDGVFQIEVALVVLEWSIRRGDLLQAEALYQAVISHINPCMPNHRQVSLDTYSQKALLRSRQGRFEEAKEIIVDQINSLDPLEIAPKARLLLQLSVMHLESSSDQFACSLPPLLECLTLTKQNRMDGMYAASLLFLAQVHLRRGNNNKCASIIQAVLPPLLQQEHVWFQAEAYLTLGKCAMMQAKHQDTTKSSKAFEVSLKLAVQKLKKSEELFRMCQDCLRLKEVYYVLARIYNSLPNSVHKRDEASKNFVLISQYLVQAANSEAHHFLCYLTSSKGLKHLAKRPLPVVTIV